MSMAQSNTVVKLMGAGIRSSWIQIIFLPLVFDMALNNSPSVTSFV